MRLDEALTFRSGLPCRRQPERNRVVSPGARGQHYVRPGHNRVNVIEFPVSMMNELVYDLQHPVLPALGVSHHEDILLAGSVAAKRVSSDAAAGASSGRC